MLGTHLRYVPQIFNHHLWGSGGFLARVRVTSHTGCRLRKIETPAEERSITPRQAVAVLLECGGFRWSRY